MNLAELNARWQETGHVHAELQEGQSTYVWFCPSCGGRGVAHLDLVGSMSAALGHKNRCVPVDSESLRAGD